MKEINNCFNDFLDSNESPDRKYIKLILGLKRNLKDLVKLRDHLMELEKNYRNGFSTYGYDDFESIYANLEYISDRWGAAFRVNWLIGLIDPSDIYHASEWNEVDYVERTKINF